jgi:hypothetical protein
MKFYSFEEIRQKGSCIKFAQQVLGVKVNSDNRCAAIWRGGKNENSVALKDEEWYDHSAKIGFGLIELCQISKFGGIQDSNKQQAQEFLGDWLGLTPVKTSKKTTHEEGRYKQLIADGYKEAARYYYKDDNGNLVHIVVKLTHPDKHKEFLQKTPQHWGLGDTVPVLYNRENWKDSSWVVVVEGEKDADTLKAWGIPATTNCGGSKKWRPEYNELFKGKNVVICRDNDDAGKAHAHVVSKNLCRVANTLRCFCPSALPKGDVTDWRDKEGGTYQEFMARISALPQVTPDEADKSELELALLEAKEANQKPFTNTRLEFGESQEGKGKKVEKPAKVSEMIADIKRRFLGFPRKIGGRMFDHDRDTDSIQYFDKSSELIPWIAAKSKQNVFWSTMAGALSKEEFFAAVRQHAIRYESVSKVPDYPLRNDVYYMFKELPLADEHHSHFNKLISFFSMHNEVSRILLRSLFAAPVVFRHGQQRPIWIVDSMDGRGVGKTTVIELLAYLYDCEPLTTTKTEIENNYQEIVKRILSTTGRNSRIFLMDNVTGDLKSPALAQLSTQWAISGKPPYGTGEETRPNNLTYCVTSNSASVNSDIADRAFFIYVKKTERKNGWKDSVMSFIRTYRFEIFADIIDLLENHTPFEMAPVTRVPEFEVEVIQAMCETIENYDLVKTAIMKTKSETNLDEDEARYIEEQLGYRFLALGIRAAESKVFVRSDVIELWFKDRHVKTQDLRDYSKSGLLNCIDKEKRRIENKEYRCSGVLWVGKENKSDEMHVIGIGPDGKAMEIVSLYSNGKKVEPGMFKSVEQAEAELDLG